MGLLEIKRNPNIKEFVIKRNNVGGWSVFFMIDKEVFQVKTQREQQRNFKTLDNAVRYIESTGKTNKVTVIIK